MPAAAEDLDAQVQRLDPERWLASRLIADANARATVIALYALNLELARVGETVTQPLAGEIRLAWWRDQIEALVSGGPAPAQPVLKALAPAVQSGALPLSLLGDLIEARHSDLDAEPFADDAALARYLDGTAGAIMAMVARLLDADASLTAVIAAGRAWGLTGLYRARAHWTSRNRRWTPATWGDPVEDELAKRVRADVAQAMATARAEIRTLPVAAFPAVAYATLVKAYAAGRAPGPLECRLRLVLATAAGRL